MQNFIYSVQNLETWNENQGGIYSIYLERLSAIQRKLYLDEFKIFKTIADKNAISCLMQHPLNKVKLINAYTEQSDVEITARKYSEILRCCFYLIRKKNSNFSIDSDLRIKIWISRKQLNDYLNLDLININNYNILFNLLRIYDISF